jgi:DNA adenine methylase
MTISLIPYIGGKHRIVGRISERLHRYGRDTLVDVFGGSGAVTFNAGFQKRIYNDLSDDLVNMMRCIANPLTRRMFIASVRWSPPSRSLFLSDYEKFVAGCMSFRLIADPIERARATFYRAQFCFGGKMRSGGFSVSAHGRSSIKEVFRYRNALRKFSAISELLRGTVIDHMHYQDCIAVYGKMRDVVLYVDPPYDGTENYYCCEFGYADHTFLASALANSPAPAVVSYYDTPLVRSLYPESLWEYQEVETTKNTQGYRTKKQRVQELIISRRAA